MNLSGVSGFFVLDVLFILYWLATSYGWAVLLNLSAVGIAAGLFVLVRV